MMRVIGFFARVWLFLIFIILTIGGAYLGGFALKGGHPLGFTEPAGATLFSPLIAVAGLATLVAILGMLAEQAGSRSDIVVGASADNE